MKADLDRLRELREVALDQLARLRLTPDELDRLDLTEAERRSVLERIPDDPKES